MLKTILLVLGALVLGFLVLAFLQPTDYRVARSTTIQAGAATVFPLVNDFHQWEKWSPWAKLDPNMKTTYSGEPAGKGAVYLWSGNDQVGEGRMTIEESRPNELIAINLEFLEPFDTASKTTFAFKESGGQTTVDWIMTGQNNFMSKAIGLVMGGMDKMVGPDFEKGLAQLKATAEAAK